MTAGLPQPAFLLDANVFIQASQQYYPFDVCPGFWECLSGLSEQGMLTSIDRVLAELQGHDDDLKQWANATPGLFSSSADPLVVDAYEEVIQWVTGNSQFKPKGKADFAEKADGWIVAYAKVHGLIVVTHETYASEARKRVPIPNACERFGVLSMDTFDMLRILGARFEWRRP